MAILGSQMRMDVSLAGLEDLEDLVDVIPVFPTWRFPVLKLGRRGWTNKASMKVSMHRLVHA